MSLKGIDVSYHQGNIDWKKVRESGVEFAIIRAGYGKSTVDKKFIENIVGADTAGLKIGIYWFIYAANEGEAVLNALKCNETIQLYKDAITLGVWADWEYDSDKRNPQTKESRTAIVKTFNKTLSDNGWNVGVYANPDYINNKFGDLSEYPLWLAWYGATEEKAAAYNPVMFQQSSKGIVDGISGNVDLDILYAENAAAEEKEEEEPTGNGRIAIYAYSKAKNGVDKLSENFKVKEFACKDGSDVIFVAPELVGVLQKIRNHFGKSVVINSGYRTAAYNAKIGGATYSQHCYGTAADIAISGVNPKDVAEYVETLMPNTGGIGIYQNFTHVDVRKEKSRWNG